MVESAHVAPKHSLPRQTAPPRADMASVVRQIDAIKRRNSAFFLIHVKVRRCRRVPAALETRQHACA